MFQGFEPTWTFTESLYYCTITATTIGFGDFVPDSGLNDPSGGGIFKALIVILYIAFSKFQIVIVQQLHSPLVG